MSDRQVDESVIRADRLSKVIALFAAIGTFLVAARMTGDVQFNMIVAAFVGIGVRIYVPYHASITTGDPDHEPIQAYEGTGNYHQGAVGAAVTVAAIAALVAMTLEPDSTRSLVAGAGVGVVSFFALRSLLPS
ncbi:hypothetical protein CHINAEXTREME_09100 [Halobiforma lacisalsi AJ5]|uniref:Uncharacterized protein n=1 Tax=Natronobacterium lacisalsi AJ5 TaxID=358396 RepID=M0L7X5_NATLA|nr:hypothetical protein [Halobiforma lacisalsi]APW97928.1 hypothetical protein CHINAEXTREME_09100 [Halobiforma lacisalsi AJ5]EMA29198.1 hypothetical protein C445_17669 [Halobiforma lacisalsi AJ5]